MMAKWPVRLSPYKLFFGGQEPTYTFRNNPELSQLFAQFYESGKPTAGVCHAVTLLPEAKQSNGDLIADGKTWTGFADAEGDYVDSGSGQRVQPYPIEQEARKLPNTTFRVAAPFRSSAIADGNITGQQQHSGTAVARTSSGPV
jgi:putative intracellular protease/amidase